MVPDNQDVIKQILSSIRKLARAVYLDSQKMGRRFGLTGPQSVILRLLIKRGPMPSAELSRLMFVTPSNITGIIDRLEKKELVTRKRKEGDRRVALITLTDSGKRLSEIIPDPIEKKLINEFSDMESDHVQILAKAMNQILNLIDASSVEEAPLEISQEPVSHVQGIHQKRGVGK